MVTAGVYMIARCGTLFVTNSAAMTTIAVIGCFTALLAATIALRQFDLKKVFAYSTISQLGFMFTAVGCLAPVAGVFHLVTHAFFKALLFLSSGVVMHAMAGELDMRRMSGLRKVLPITNVVILIGCLALAGFPLTSGFFSKDEIVAAAFARSPILGALLLFAAFMTAYYTFRLYFQVFMGPLLVPPAPASAHGHGHDVHEDAAASHSAIETHTAPSSGVDVGQTAHAPAQDADDHHHNHEPWVMMLPLILLAIGALFGGFFNFHDGLGDFLGKSPSFDLAWKLTTVPGANFGQPEAEASHGISWIMVFSGLISIAGIALAYLLHLRDRASAEKLAGMLQPFTHLIENKFYVDELYQEVIVEPLRLLGRVLYVIDRTVVDGLVRVVGYVPQICGFLLSQTTERGYLQGYAATMLVGIAVILILIFMR
jgi:NADH-quinone oxidoreductase subunit L